MPGVTCSGTELLVAPGYEAVMVVVPCRVEISGIGKAAGGKPNADKMAADKMTFGRRYGQLLSYVFQRYIKGDDQLSDSQQSQLVSVLVETEKSSLAKLVGKSSDIKKAVESGDPNSLLNEYNKLFGDSAKPGQLSTELKFDYGKAADDSALKTPLPLADPPAG